MGIKYGHHQPHCITYYAKFSGFCKDPIAYSLGAKLLNLLQYKSDSVTSLNTFLSYFKGLCVYPDAGSSGVVYGFRDTSFVKLYYHEPGVITNSTFIIFPFNAKGHQFNNISFDRTGTQLASINNPVYAVPYTNT